MALSATLETWIGPVDHCCPRAAGSLIFWYDGLDEPVAGSAAGAVAGPPVCERVVAAADPEVADLRRELLCRLGAVEESLDVDALVGRQRPILLVRRGEYFLCFARQARSFLRHRRSPLPVGIQCRCA